MRAARALGPMAFLVASHAAAATPSADTCASSYEEAQRRQAKGALLDAREQLASCADPRCPTEIVEVCASLARELEQSIPTIVVVAVDDAGADVPDATVVVDDRAQREPLDGRSLSLDPGVHRLTITRTAPAATTQLTITVNTGEKNRRVEARFTGKAPRRDDEAERDDGAPLLVPMVVAFSIGGAGLVLGGITGGIALSEDAALGDRCATPATCPPDERGRIDRMESLGVASTIGFVVGGLGVATGVVLAIVGAASTGPVSATAGGIVVAF